MCHGECATLLPVPLSLSLTVPVVEVSLWMEISLFLIVFHFDVLLWHDEKEGVIGRMP